MLRSDPLLRALPILRPRLPRLLLATVCGVLSLGSALALAAVSAWLITKAWQMPPVLDLSVAVVAVRALAISRGVLHYCERLASHDTALRAAASAREQIYRLLAHGPAVLSTAVPSGDLVGRLGSDVDEFSDVLVRAVLPVAVAAVLAVAAVGVIAVISPAAAVVLAVCLLVAGVLAPWLAARGSAAQEQLARTSHTDRDVAAMLALEHAAELRVAGRLGDVIAESGRRQRQWGEDLDRAAAPAAVGAAVPVAAIGAAVVGAAVVGIGIASSVAPTTLAILMLLPLSAFEATTALPAAAIQLTRSRIAAARLLELTEAAEPAPPAATGIARGPAPGPVLQAAGVRAGFDPTRPGPPVNLELSPGSRVAVVGPSGSGKTTLLMTLAGLIPPLTGSVTVCGTPIGELGADELPAAVSFFAEDAHLFDTTVRDNLLVVRGDCTDAEVSDALERVGLGPWLCSLPDGLATVLSGGAAAVSAGQRRRLLLARVLLSRARAVLLDEPTEHLDAADSDAILQGLLGGDLLPADRIVVVATHHLPGQIDCPVLQTTPGR